MCSLCNQLLNKVLIPLSHPLFFCPQPLFSQPFFSQPFFSLKISYYTIPAFASTFFFGLRLLVFSSASPTLTPSPTHSLTPSNSSPPPTHTYTLLRIQIHPYYAHTRTNVHIFTPIPHSYTHIHTCTHRHIQTRARTHTHKTNTHHVSRWWRREHGTTTRASHLSLGPQLNPNLKAILPKHT